MSAAGGSKKPTKDNSDPFGELVSFTSTSSSVSPPTMASQQRQQAKLSLRERQNIIDEQTRSRSGSPMMHMVASQQQQQQQAAMGGKDLWNFDVLEKAGSSRSTTPRIGSVANSNSNAMDFDPLADFSTPPKATTTTTITTITPSIPMVEGSNEPIPMDVNPPPPTTTMDSFVDKDFEISQIVDYGYTVGQAKTALEITGGVRPALQLLREQQSSMRQMEERKKPHSNHSRYADSSSDEDDGTGRHYYQRNAAGNGENEAMGADKLLATANEFGTNVWKQANSWFNMGKKKIIEMQETMMDSNSNYRGERWDVAYQSPYLQQPGQQGNRCRYDQESSDEDVDEDAGMYVSANRRRGARGTRPNGSHRPPLSRGSPQQPAAEPKPRMATPQPKQMAAAPIPPVSLIVLQNASNAKTSANEQFKLGQFGDAIAGYASAITMVSQHAAQHPILIVLYNNRALAYIRNGEEKSAVADCTKSLDMCDIYQANGTIDLSVDNAIAVVEQRSKALQRRAEAYEAIEKYRDGLTDWKNLREITGDPGTRRQSIQGIQRCEKALGISQPASSNRSTTSTPVNSSKKPPAEDLNDIFASISIANVKSGGTTILTQHTENSAAVAEMRRAEQAKRAEEDQRLELIDHVDEELKKWRDGKQQNLRALLSSLHTLVPDFKPIQMHEILEPNKVKRAYMRAISKLHPDKLSKDIDLRSKMIASSVFSSLNEAWDAFKTQENIS